VIRLSLVLLIVLLGSALLVVNTQYASRHLYMELEKANSLGRKIETEKERLQVDRRAQATPLRVEQLAQDKLQMRTTTPAVTQYVNHGVALVTSQP
jgi:cell division protein FtsL